MSSYYWRKPMTIAQLKEKIKDYPDDFHVFFDNPDSLDLTPLPLDDINVNMKEKLIMLGTIILEEEYDKHGVRL